MVKKIVVNYGKDIDIDYIKYGEDTEYNHFVCLDDYYSGAIRHIKILKSNRIKYRQDDIIETEYIK